VPQLRKALTQVYWNWHYHRTAGPKFDPAANAICGRGEDVRCSGVLRGRAVSGERESAAGDGVRPEAVRNERPVGGDAGGEDGQQRGGDEGDLPVPGEGGVSLDRVQGDCGELREGRWNRTM